MFTIVLTRSNMNMGNNHALIHAHFLLCDIGYSIRSHTIIVAAGKQRWPVNTCIKSGRITEFYHSSVNR